MNKIYKILFWSARSITFLTFGILLFSMLNAKYMLSENFFPLLLNLAKTNCISAMVVFETMDSTVTIPLYKIFAIFSQFLDILVIFVILNFIIYYVYYSINTVINRKKIIQSVIIYIFMLILLYLLISIFITAKILFLTYAILPIIYSIIVFLNRITLYQKFLILIPIVGDCLFPIYILQNYYKLKNRHLLKTLAINCCFIFSFFIAMCFVYDKLLLPNRNLLENNSYSICIDNKNKKTFVKFPTGEGIVRIGKDIKYYYQNSICGQSQSMVFNSLKNELYMCDSMTGILYVLNAKDLSILRWRKIFNIVNPVVYRIEYANYNNTIAIVPEDTYKMVVINMKTLDFINSYDIRYPNDGICFNPIRKTYMMTSWEFWPFIQEISINNEIVNRINIPSAQGYIKFSKQNKEIYIAFHQRGRIYVYDAETMQLKRKIKSNYSVKNITYDKDLNVLIAPSYFTGYVDIFLMDGTDRLLTRQFVGYLLREARFSPDKQYLYVASHNALYKIKMEIKKY